MAKNFYVKGCGTDKPRDSLLSFRYIFVLGLLILVGSVSWLFWRKSELPVQLIPERDGLQSTAVASVQEAMNSTAENDYVKQKNVSKGNYAVEGSTSSSHDRGFVIQVGAFRRIARAENLQKALQDKGYDAYLETRTLPEHGLIHRVRIRGYTSLVDARAEMERLHKEEGLDSFALTMEPNLPMSGRK
jgi:hypothetical protein